MALSGATPDGVIYLDETTPNTGCHAAIAAVSVAAGAVSQIEADVRTALIDLRELKFSEMSDGRQARSAQKILQVVYTYCERDLLRVDALSWDKTDSRHAIAKRDDYANMSKMLRHLLNASAFVQKKERTSAKIAFMCSENRTL